MCPLICLLEQVHAVSVSLGTRSDCVTMPSSEGSGSPETVKPLSTSPLDTGTTQGPEHNVWVRERAVLRKFSGVLREECPGRICPAVRQDRTSMPLMLRLRKKNSWSAQSGRACRIEACPASHLLGCNLDRNFWTSPVLSALSATQKDMCESRNARLQSALHNVEARGLPAIAHQTSVATPNANC